MIITKTLTTNFAKDSRSLSESDILDNIHLFVLKLLKKDKYYHFQAIKSHL